MQRKVFKLMATLGLAAAMFVGSASNSQAAVLSFDQLVDGGFLSYGGNLGDPLIGTDITFDSIDDGTLFLTCDCVLNFQTGGSIVEDPLGLQITVFGAGGYFVLSGTAYDGAVAVATGDLITGSFTGNPTITDGGAVLSFSGFGIDTKDAALLAYFGITDPNFTFANTEISGATGLNNEDAFRINVEDGDITNTSSAPEPATMSLFGLALLGLGGAVRRRFTA